MLPSYNATHLLSLVAEEALEPGRRVKFGTAAEGVVYADDEACIGVTINRAYAVGDPVTVLDIRCPGTLPFTASGAIAAGAAFTSAADGKVATGTAGAQDYGRAITAATADGGMFEGYAGL